MKILGLDLGSKTLGVAISDALGIVASPIETYKINENDLQMALGYVKMLVDKYKIKKVVLGFPKNMNGTIGPQAEYCLAFKDMIEKDLMIEVIMIDERLTSKIANRVMIKADISRKKRKNNIDKLAASIILQTYLDSIIK